PSDDAQFRVVPSRIALGKIDAGVTGMAEQGLEPALPRSRVQDRSARSGARCDLPDEILNRGFEGIESAKQCGRNVAFRHVHEPRFKQAGKLSGPDYIRCRVRSDLARRRESTVRFGSG